MRSSVEFFNLALSKLVMGSLLAQETAVCNFEVASSKEAAGQCDNTPWCLVFSDEFEGTSIFARCHNRPLK